MYIYCTFGNTGMKYTRISGPRSDLDYLGHYEKNLDWLFDTILVPY